MIDASDEKPISATARNGSAYQMRRRLLIFHTMRQPSAKLGATSSVFAASSEAPIARRSNDPRIGSRIRHANTTNTNVGNAKMMNGQRQPKRAPTTPATSGPTHAPTALAARWNEYTRGLDSMS